VFSLSVILNSTVILNDSPSQIQADVSIYKAHSQLSTPTIGHEERTQQNTASPWSSPLFINTKGHE